MRGSALPPKSPLALAVILTLSLASSMAAKKAPRSLTPAERVAVFEKVWKDVDEHYYDPKFGGVDWQQIHQRYLPLVEQTKDDQSFYALLDRMTGELHDAHTRFSSPEQWEDRKKHEGVSTGFRAGMVEGRVVVLEVYAGSNAERAGVRPGMLVTALDGQPILERWAEAAKAVLPSSTERITQLRILSNVFSAPLETPVNATFQRADGSMLDAKFARQIRSTAAQVISARTASGFGYIRFDEFQRSLLREFMSALDQMRGAPGLILDLRWNHGGDGATLQAMADAFFARKTLFERRMSRRQVGASERGDRGMEETLGYAVARGERAYTAPLVVLLSVYSASAAEIFAAGMQDAWRARIVGTPSCGCVLGITHDRVMKGGGVLEISEVLWFSPRGRRLEGEGVVPDKVVAPTIASLQARKDVVLEEGEETLRELVAGKANAATP
jgi:carboxyl-terminal processing protease